MSLPPRLVLLFNRSAVAPAIAPRRRGIVLTAFAVCFLATHLPFLPTDPGSVDSVNFLMGVQHYDVADHRPHPPGAPVFIAFGKAYDAVVGPSDADSARSDVRALAVWSTLFAALLAFPAFAFFRGLESNDRCAVAAAALTLASPLVWFVAIRPVSDATGLAAAVVAQALTVMALRSFERKVPGSRALTLAALVAGLAIGIRVQNGVLTVPLLMVAVARSPNRIGSLLKVTAAFATGVTAWAVPLLVASHGPMGYLAALTAQGNEDLAGAALLATNPTLGGLVRGLVESFAYPWGHTALAAAVLGFGAVGTVVMAARSRLGVGLLIIAILPYALFTLLFQETFHTRYALPLVPAMAYVAVRGLDALLPRVMPWAVAGLALAGLALVFPATVAFARSGSPAQQALSDISDRVSEGGSPPVLAMHHSLSRVMRGERLPLRTLPSTPRREWRGLVDHWQREADSRVWFLAESGRRDLALIDPASRRLVRSYGWPFRRKFLMGRVPTDGLDWFEMAPPAWMAVEGWSLSLEAAGMAALDRQIPGDHPLRALVRRHAGPAVLMIGGRRLSGATSSAVLTLSLKGQPLESWTVEPEEGSFLRMWRLPAGTLTGDRPYLPLGLRIGDESAGLIVDQFNIQPATSLVYGYDLGWYQQESDGGRSRSWRWTGPVAEVRVHHGDRDLVLDLTASVPLEYLDGLPQISVRAGDTLLARFAAPGEQMRVEIHVPAEALSRASGVLSIETDRAFVPDAVMGNGDQRELSLRVYRLVITEAVDGPPPGGFTILPLQDDRL